MPVSGDPDLPTDVASLPGRFWLATAPQVVVPGRLTLLPDGVLLQLDGSLTLPWERTVHTDADGGTHTRYEPLFWEDPVPMTIHGDLSPDDDEEGEGGGEPVTLVEVAYRGGSLPVPGAEVGPGRGTQQWRGPSAVRGAHVDDAGQRYAGVRVRLRHLEDWAGAGSSHGLSGEAGSAAPTVVVASATLAEGGHVHLDQETPGQLDDENEDRQRPVWLRVVLPEPMTWHLMDRTVLTPLVTLLSLAVGADCSPVAIEVTPHPFPDAAGSARWLRLHSAALHPPAARPRPAHTMLLPRAVLGLEAVAAWLDHVEVLGPLPPVVAASAAGRQQLLETRVLELTTIAESLARRLWPGARRLTEDQAQAARSAAAAAVADQEKEVVDAVTAALTHVEELSYPKRLLQLAEDAGQVVPDAVGRRNEHGQPSRWKKVVFQARNDFAHGLNPGWVSEGGVERYLAVVYSLRWLLTAVLLLRTGVPPETLRARLQAHQPYQLFLEQARHWLPEVYT